MTRWSGRRLVRKARRSGRRRPGLAFTASSTRGSRDICPITDNVKCLESGTLTYVPHYSNYVYHDAFGVSHPLPYTATYCAPFTFTGSGVPAADGSGYSYNGIVLTSADGKQIDPPVNSQASSGSIADTNGNYISNNGNGTFTDTLGKTALTITGNGTASSPRLFTYSTPTGTAAVTVAL